ncbi:hypothetical protein BG011_001352 [Mortierella polycephala]|uniref:BHLH domain-containing protein n=1 Tax=Mortierella polycephala TaxID=41804 RepID=A0A9P6Q5L6_9FUNG|nr:hypothetical protein BG011_001352 [Mortierella polycephala]
MTATTASPTAPTKNVFRLHGVNVLNRKNVDSISRLTALEKRRATHILDERQRRDTMNQLLAELANLVRESAAEAEAQAQQQQQNDQSQLNADGTEKKPPVKSNSITTLRNAITEIRRLRSCAGLETFTPPCAASLVAATPHGSRSSSPSSQKQQQQQQQQQLPALAPLPPNYNTNSGSCHSTPMSSPKVYASHVPMAPHHQLQSPPLSPSRPAQKYTSVSPPMMPLYQSNQTSSLPSLFAPSSSVSHPSNQPPSSQYYAPAQPQHRYQQQQQPQQQQPYYQSQPQYSPRYEPVQSYSRPPSPGLASSKYSTVGPAPSMLLPQSYMQNPPAYSSSSYGPM